MEGFHPIVAEWFTEALGEPTPPQIEAWPRIRAGEDVLVAAPTGSGKTLAAFLVGLDRLICRASELGDETILLYVSPLKALGNDVQKNLDGPLAEIRRRFLAADLPMPGIRTAVRTGDTKQSERAKIAKKPPHVLVTTPESLYILLTSESGRKALATVESVIVDEIHAVCATKRGQHLALSLERLDRLVQSTGRPRPQRIGLSATQRPIEVVAGFLVGAARANPLQCAIVNAGHRREMVLSVELPREELSAVTTKEAWGDVADAITAIVRQNRSTLVFVDTRFSAERFARFLGERLGADQVVCHHGALSREVRLRAEQRLKTGDVPVCVATASLELGIDIGSVDVCCLIGGPRSISVGLQRIGRAGHSVRAVPRAVLFPTTRDELQAAAAFLYGVRRGRLEATCIPKNARDVLAQQIVAIASAEGIDEDELFALVRGAQPYADLPRDTFDAIVTMLSDGIATQKGRRSALLHRDGINRRVKGRRGARLAAMTSGGAIPDTADYDVIADPDQKAIGKLNEDFAIESNVGDVIVLGATSWRIRKVEPSRVRVEAAPGSTPTVPFWLGEGPGRTEELSSAVSDYRREIDPLLDDIGSAERFAVAEGLSPEAARQLVAYLAAGKATLGVLPREDLLVAERFFDDSGGMQLIIHAPLGMKRNRALGHALRKRFCRSFDFELQAAASDEGVLLSLGPQHSFPVESIFEFLEPEAIDDVLEQAAQQSPLFQIRWRWASTRSLAVLRFGSGKKVPPNLLRMRCDDLLSAVFPAQTMCQDNAGGGPIEVPDHPLAREAMDDCLSEALDARGLERVLRQIQAGTVVTLGRDVPEPSPLCHELVNGKPYMFIDDAPLEERRARAVNLRRTLPPAERGLGLIDAETIAEIVPGLFPDARDADEVHDALLSLGCLPAERTPTGWLGWLDELQAARRALPMQLVGAGVSPAHSRPAWIAAERADLLLDRDALIPAMVAGWMPLFGPIDTERVAERLGISVAEAAIALGAMEADGRVLRGAFTRLGAEEWCDRGVLGRLQRATLGRLRRMIEPVTPADFVRFLGRWQHVTGRLHGVDGLREVIAQLQGAHAPLAAWEAEILPARVANYETGLLDRLCAEGTVVWGRFAVDPSEGPRRAATRVVPVTLALREDVSWLLRGGNDAEPLSVEAAAVLAELDRRGAVFVADLVRATRLRRDDVDRALGELVAAGKVTCDGFGGPRALVSGGNGAAGRWARIFVEDPPDDTKERRVMQLLRRFGVLFRDVVAREADPWREIAPILRSLEARGIVRGGRFVSGFSGEQYALPSAVEALRSARRAPPGEHLDVAAADPLNLVGILTPGPRIPSTSGSRVHYVDGVPDTADPIAAAS